MNLMANTELPEERNFTVYLPKAGSKAGYYADRSLLIDLKLADMQWKVCLDIRGK
jgi:hypothetical protein